MGQFDVYRNADPRTRKAVPYLLDVQADLLSDLQSRVVVPLVPADETSRPMGRLNPVFSVRGQDLMMAATELAGAPLQCVGEKVASLAGERDTIIAALDFVFNGF